MAARPMPAASDALGGGGAAASSVVCCYHQTSVERAERILASQAMRRGPPGWAGPGLYFAAEPHATHCKANAKGCILECLVDLGRVRVVTRASDWSSRLRRLLHRCDSVLLTFLEGGIEFVVYEPSRVKAIRLLQRCDEPCCGEAGAEPARPGSFRIGTALCHDPAEASTAFGSSLSGGSECGTASSSGSECSTAFGSDGSGARSVASSSSGALSRLGGQSPGLPDSASLASMANSRSSGALRARDAGVSCCQQAPCMLPAHQQCSVSAGPGFSGCASRAVL